MIASHSNRFTTQIPSSVLIDLHDGIITEWGILAQEGAQLTAKKNALDQDFLVIRTPARSNYWNGNYLYILNEFTDISPWIDSFQAEFPLAKHMTLRIPHRPSHDFYTAYGLELETRIVLTTQKLPRETLLTSSYPVHALETDEDWQQYYRQNMTDNDHDKTFNSTEYSDYLQDAIQANRSQVATGRTKFFGAFHPDGTLISSLGITLIDDKARYQNIGTSPRHRRQGLAGHLIYKAALWALEQGAQSWVIITDESNPAAQLYRKLGFQDTAQIFELCKTPQV